MVDEIKKATDHITFGLTGSRKANAVAWAEMATRSGYDAAWAIDWILRGFPEPPKWMSFDEGDEGT